MALAWSAGLLVEAVVIAVLTWAVVRLAVFLRQFYLLYKGAAQFPSLPKHWLWGTIPTLREMGRANFSRYLVEQTKKHGKAFVFWRGSLCPEVFVTHSETVGQILKTSEPKNQRFKAGYTLSKPWLGDGLLISNGKKWERNRKLLTPAFHFNVLQPYIKVYNDAVDNLLPKFHKASKTAESFEVFDPMALCTLDVMLRCAFSYEDNIQRKAGLHPYVRAVKRLANLISNRGLKPHMRIDWLYALTTDGKEFNQLCDYVHGFADKIIEARRSTLESVPDVARKRHLDFLDILLAARDEFGEGLSKEDIRAEVDTFLFEGHDTTASAASWALYALAKYPDVQEKVYREVHEILGDRESLEWPDIPKLKYTSLFIKEVMRMYSPVPGIGRELSKPLEIDGKEVPAGTVIIISLRTLNHNPEVWESPEEFRPERFSEDKFSSRDPYSFVPFSAGPRNCIGQTFALNEEKVIVSRIVNKFRIVLDKEHPIVMIPELIMRAEHGIKVKFFPRNQDK
ncbi:cytochrome P450 4A25-like [Liolophura sinensis]|uniref:cytochrome P450 4A25-like n=1 Tax=Liolophura sinensis TaxID=3198878 RepID=UPI003159449D